MTKETKTVIVTGGLGGIGLNLVIFFYKKKFNIIILDNKPRKDYLKLRIKKSNFQNTITYKKIDLSKPSLIKKLFITLKNQYKKIDVLINCAGVQHINSIESFPEYKWEKIIKIN